MEDSYLNNVLNKLLDVGKRNQLINFKNRITSSIEFYFDDFYDLFEELKEGDKFQVAKLFTNLDENITLSLIEEEEYNPYNVKNVVTNAQGLMIERCDKYDFKQIKTIKNRFKPKANTSYLYPLSIYSVCTKTLNLLKRKAKTFKEENGIDALYLCFGFFEYVEDNVSYLAPTTLIPVNISKNYKDEWFINASDDEYLINENFCHYLKLNYNITLPKKEDNLQDYLEKTKEVLDQTNIKVLELVALSLFSFGKIVMYNDILENYKLTSDAPLVKFFSSGTKTSLNKEKEKLKPYIVLPSDSSQREAIEKALSGDSFVLEGPPGTGKSQTITNMIASLIGNNKKVLFVCEKQSALDIVYKNLVKSGISTYALPIYDNKANKKEVVKNIFENIQNKKKLSNQLNSKGKSLEKKYLECNEFFDKYKYILKTKTKLGKTIFEILEDALFFKRFNNFKYDNVLALDCLSYEKLIKEVEVVDKGLVNLNTSPKSHAYFGFLKEKISKADLKKLFQNINSCSNIIEKINKEYLDIDEELIPPNLFELSNYIEILSFFNNDYKLKYSDFSHYDVENDLVSLNKVESLYNKQLKYKNTILKRYNESILDIDLTSDLKLLKEKYNSSIKRLIGFNKILNKYKLYLKNGDLDYSTLVSDLETIIKFKEINEHIIVLDAKLKTEYPKYYFGSKTDFNKLRGILTYLKDFNIVLSKIDTKKKNTIINLIIQNDKDFTKNYMYLKSYSDSIEDSFNFILNYFDKNSLNLSFIDLNTKFKKILYDTDSIYSYLEFVKDFKNLNTDIKDLINNEEDLTDFKLKFIASLNYYYLEELLKTKNQFDMFTNAMFDKFLEDFNKLSLDVFEIAKVNIADNITKTWPNLNSIDEFNLEVSILRKEVEKKRKLLSIRSLFSQISNLVQTLKPVMIMSALAVSQYLDSDKFEFDTVIFDEASQLTEENTIASIRRAKQMIIVGDKEQLAPTSFFDSSQEDEDDDYLVFSSVLDKANSRLDSIMLKWHYRSKYESLINFSNKAIYKDLYTFPSSEKDNDNGLQYINANGEYIKNSCINIIEAKKVVDTLFYLIRHTNNKSIGIVTFNMSQENLIYHYILEARKKDKAYESFFSEEKEEPFFVKNLETVQGDERDIIILSTTFGPDSNHKQSSNFGPINKDGGYKRLNVAITRARERLVVVSSVDTSLISKTSLNNKGTLMFKNFLDYAKNKDTILNQEIINSNTLEYIKNRFKIHFDVSTNIGDNKFKIDLAIKENDKYVAAIMLQNENALFDKNYDNYFNIKNILIKRGFKVFYIFITPDINQLNIQIDNIIKNLKENSPVLENNVEFDDDIISKKEEEVIDVKMLFDTFPNVISIIKDESNKGLDIKETIFNIIDKIAPIKESELEKLCKSELKLDNQTFKNIISELKSEKKIYLIVKFILTKENILNPKFRRFDDLNPYNRSIDEVFIEELETGFKEVIRFVKSTNKEILFKTFNKLLGYPSLSKLTTDIFNRVLSNLSDKGEILIEDNVIRIVR